MGPTASPHRQRAPLARPELGPAEHAQRQAPAAEQPQSAQQVSQRIPSLQDGCVPVVLLEGEDDEQVAVAVLVRGRGEGRGRHALDRIRLGDREARRQLDLRRGDREPVKRPHERELAGTSRRGALEPLERRAQSLGADVKVGLVAEHVLQQRLHRRARTRAGLRAGSIGAPGGQVAIEPVEALEELGRLGVARQTFERSLALGDEVARQRAVTVEGRCAASATELGPDVERNLRTGLHLGAQVACGRLEVVGEGAMQLPRTHPALPSL